MFIFTLCNCFLWPLMLFFRWLFRCVVAVFWLFLMNSIGKSIIHITNEKTCGVERRLWFLFAAFFCPFRALFDYPDTRRPTVARHLPLRKLFSDAQAKWHEHELCISSFQLRCWKFIGFSTKSNSWLGILTFPRTPATPSPPPSPWQFNCANIAVTGVFSKNLRYTWETAPLNTKTKCGVDIALHFLTQDIHNHFSQFSYTSQCVCVCALCVCACLENSIPISDIM